MKRLVLAGGGHAHIEVLRRFALRPPDDVELTLVTPQPRLIYTGMLPGLIAGHYRPDECMIDLEGLAARAQCRWIAGSVAGIDTQRGSVVLREADSLDYDLLSLDVGTAPPLDGVPGAREHAHPVKPADTLLQWWEGIVDDRALRPGLRIGVIGGGAGGVELALAMRHRLTASGARGARLFLLTDAPDILIDHHPRARRLLGSALRVQGIEVHTHARVTNVEDGLAFCGDGRDFAFDALVWATGAAPPEWVAQTGLATAKRGFVGVRDTLQCVSFDNVFAAGDVASMVNSPRPKSGVYAVRQGPVLAENLHSALMGRSLTSYRPQRRALALISTGARQAIASRGALVLAGAWVWRWKDWIDRRFVARYRA